MSGPPSARCAGSCAPGGAPSSTSPRCRCSPGTSSILSHEIRRYTAPGLRAALEHGGFAVERLTYTNATMLPILLPLRLAHRVLGLAPEEGRRAGDPGAGAPGQRAPRPGAGARGRDRPARRSAVRQLVAGHGAETARRVARLSRLLVPVGRPPVSPCPSGAAAARHRWTLPSGQVHPGASCATPARPRASGCRTACARCGAG